MVERDQSFSAQSNSSFGSGVNSEDGSVRPEAEQDEMGNEEDEIQVSTEVGIFGLMHAVTKDKSESVALAVIRMFFDWLQVLLLLVNPAWGWQMNTEDRFWRAFSFVGLAGMKYSAVTRGYTFFILFMYILAISLFVVLGLCIWAAMGFRRGQFELTWPINIIRVYSVIFFQVLNVAMLSVFLIPWDCTYFSPPDATPVGNNVEYPNVQCFSMPHMIHLAVSMLAALALVTLASAFTMGDVETNPLGHKPMAMAHTKAEVCAFLIKATMTFVSFFMTGLRWMSVFQFMLAFGLAYLYLRWLPHQQPLVNHTRVGYTFTISWASLIFLLIQYLSGPDTDAQTTVDLQRSLTITFWVGCLPVAIVGFLLSVWRTKYMTTKVPRRFKDAPTGTKARNIYQFWDAREIEIISRCCRRWEDDEREVLDQDSADLALTILKAGVVLLPREAYATILVSSFMTNVLGSHQSGRLELKTARRMPSVSALERYYLYVLEKDVQSKSIAVSSGADGENVDMDMASYLEHQRNYKLTLARHVEALLATRAFWQTLLARNVTFNKLVSAVQHIESATRTAEKQYKLALSRHSTSVDILNLYVKFLTVARYDPWSAAKWAGEVEKLQHSQEEGNHRMLLGQEDSAKMQGNSNNKAVIVMGANCIVRMANATAASVLGYANRADLVGRNVNMIVPPPFQQNHNQYVRNYIETGEGQVINRLREFVALHKDGYVVPVMVLISKVSGIGEDSVFMAAFDVLPQDPDTASAWILNSGQVLSCDQLFTDWFGYRHDDLEGNQMSRLLMKPWELEELFHKIRTEFAAAQAGNLDANSATKQTMEWVLQGVNVRHLYRDRPILVDMQVTVGGVGSTSLFRIKFRLCEAAEPPLLVSDSKGRLVHVTKSLAKALGKSVQELQGGRTMHALDALLPLPFQKLHHQYCRNSVEVPAPYTCMSGLIMPVTAYSLEHGQGVLPVKMTMKHKDIAGRESVTVAVMEPRTHEQMMAERRVQLIIDNKGVIQSLSQVALSMFGFDMAGLVGSHLAYIIDVLQPGHDNGGPASLAAAADMINTMAKQGYDNPGMCWRVGVTPVMDPDTLKKLGPVGVAMMAKRMVPAVMSVQPYMEDLGIMGAERLLPPQMLFQVTVWRADLLTGVLEIDPQGQIEGLGIKGHQLFDPTLMLGLPADTLIGAPLSSLLPCGRAHIEALFTEGSMAPIKGKKGAGGRTGGLRAGTGVNARKGGGPKHEVKFSHGTDGAELEIEVQAIVRQNLGGSSSLYVMLRMMAPRCGRADFAAWLSKGEPPMLPSTRDVNNINLTTRGSVEHVPLGMRDSAMAMRDSDLAMKRGGGMDKEMSKVASKRRASVDKEGPRAGGIKWGADPEGSQDLLLDEAPPAAADPAGNDGNADEAASEGGESSDQGTEAQSVAGDAEAEDEMMTGELDAAGQSMAELKRGKLMKKLTKILISPQSQRAHVVLARMSVIMVVLLIVVDLAMFFVFHNLLAVQKTQVTDLRTTSKAINRIMQIATQVAVMGIMLDGKGVYNLRDLGQGGTVAITGLTTASLETDLKHAVNTLEIKVEELEEYHHGVFRGHGKNVQPITSSFGLREIWEVPAQPLRVFYQIPTGNTAENINMSLWDAGAQFILSTRGILQNWRADYGLSTNNSNAFQNNTDYLFILYNCLRQLTTSYEQTLDGLMQKAVTDSNELNKIQLIILAVEGACVGTITVLIMWLVARKSVLRRFAIFTVFMAVPSGVLRTLATAPLCLGQASHTEKAGDEDGGEGGGGQETMGEGDGNYAPQRQSVQAQIKQRIAEDAAAKVRLTTGTEGEAEHKSWFSKLFFWRHSNHALSTKRTLQPSPTPVLAFVWPFVLWSVLVVLLNIMGYFMLKDMAAPIAISNVVQFMSLHVNRCIYLSLRHLSGQYFTSDYLAMSPTILNSSVINPLALPNLRSLTKEYPYLREEYSAMLYGRDAPGLENTTDPHFLLATKGIMFMSGAELLYTSTDCMAQDKNDCFQKTDEFYRLTTTGLDQSMKQFFLSVENIIMAQPSQINLTHPDFKYIWEVGNGHVVGGLVKLTDVFSTYVATVYEGAEMLHVVALILCIALGLLFIFGVQRPASVRIMNETRRVGQLLSCLPTEIDVEGMLLQTMVVKSTNAEEVQSALEVALLAKSNGGKSGSKKVR